jgi:hypothetical protein
MAAAPTFETITVSTTAIGITEAIQLGQNHAILTLEGGAFRYRVDGNDPTATVGHLVLENSTLVLESRRELVNFRAFRDAAADVITSVSCSTRSGLNR